MARKYPAKVIEKKVIEPIVEPIVEIEPEIIEEVKEIEPVKAVYESFSIHPDLFAKMMRIGDNAYWNRILETFVGDMNRRYRR